MDRGPQFPEEPTASSEPERNYDQEHYQGHHDRLILGHQDECDMCRVEARVEEEEDRVRQESDQEMRDSGIDPSDRDAVRDFYLDKSRKQMDELWDYKHGKEEQQGDMSPKKLPKQPKYPLSNDRFKRKQHDLGDGPTPHG